MGGELVRQRGDREGMSAGGRATRLGSGGEAPIVARPAARRLAGRAEAGLPLALACAMVAAGAAIVRFRRARASR
jgi:hypothetical protein